MREGQTTGILAPLLESKKPYSIEFSKTVALCVRVVTKY